MIKKELLRKITPRFLILAKHYIGHYHHYHKETFAIAKELCQETGIPYLTLLLDMNLSVLRFVTPNEYRVCRFYDKSRRARNQFMTDYRMGYLNREFNYKNQLSVDPCFASKKNFYEHYSEFICRRWLYAPDASDQQIEEFLRTQKQIIVKPHDQGRGIGVRKILHSEVSDMKAFCESVRKDCLLLEEIVKQHADLSSINSTSVNTLRIITMMDKTGVPHILDAGLKMGTGQSIIDNVAGGGIVAAIDLDSGILFTPAVGKDRQTHIKHPTSGVVLPGFQIPHWEAVKEMVLRAARTAPQTIRWVGWDIAVTAKGPLVIEGNVYFNSIKQLTTQTGVYHILRSYL